MPACSSRVLPSTAKFCLVSARSVVSLWCSFHFLPSPSLSGQRYFVAQRLHVCLCVCSATYSLGAPSRGCRPHGISLGGEGNALYPVLSNVTFEFHFYISQCCQVLGPGGYGPRNGPGSGEICKEISQIHSDIDIVPGYNRETSGDGWWTQSAV